MLKGIIEGVMARGSLGTSDTTIVFTILLIVRTTPSILFYLGSIDEFKFSVTCINEGKPCTSSLLISQINGRNLVEETEITHPSHMMYFS